MVEPREIVQQVDTLISRDEEELIKLVNERYEIALEAARKEIEKLKGVDKKLDDPEVQKIVVAAMDAFSAEFSKMTDPIREAMARAYGLGLKETGQIIEATEKETLKKGIAAWPGMVKVKVPIRTARGVEMGFRWVKPEEAQRMGQRSEPSAKVGQKVKVGGESVRVTAVGKDGITARDDEGKKHLIRHEEVKEPSDLEDFEAKDLSPVKEGSVRFYHGGAEYGKRGGKAWLTTDPERAKHYARGFENEGTLHYVDISKDHPLVKRNKDEYLDKWFEFEAPEDIARNLKVVARVSKGESQPIAWKAPNIEEETGEYFENDYTQKAFEKRGLKFKNEKELIDFISKRGKLVPITREKMAERIENITIDPKDFAKELKEAGYEESYKKMNEALKHGGLDLPAPIIFDFKDTYYGFAGNRRVNLAFNNNVPLSVWMVDAKTGGRR